MPNRKNKNVKNSILLLLLLQFIFTINYSFSQIIIEITPSISPSKKVYINNLKRMGLIGINKDLLLKSNVNTYYYSTLEGAGQTDVYLDDNNIELYYNNKGDPVIIFGQKQKKKLFETKKCYHSIIVFDSIAKANNDCLFEEEKMALKPSNLFKVYEYNNHSVYSTILIGISPPVYLFTRIYLKNRPNINDSKYYLQIEFFTAKSFFELYNILSDNLISENLNELINNKYKEMMMLEINNIAQLKPKKEFETTIQYKNRLQNSNQEKVLIEKKYSNIILEFTKMSDLRLSEKIKHSLKTINLKIDSIGKYDADHQVFPLKINNITKNVIIPINEAKIFKENIDKIIVIGKEQLNDDGTTFSIFDIKIIKPISGDTILF